MYLAEIKDKLLNESLSSLPDGKILISAMNAYSFCVLQKDESFKRAIRKSNYVLSDGISIVWAMRFLTGMKIKRIAGADLFEWEMSRLQNSKGRCFFLGCCNSTLEKIRERAHEKYPDVTVGFYSPPFKREFSDEENAEMIKAVNDFSPDVLFIGMTAPKQEKWGASNIERLHTSHICCIGAVFDFFALTKKRAPDWMIHIGCEWLYRLVQEPRRNWKRYLFGNSMFIHLIMMEKVANVSSRLNIHPLSAKPLKHSDSEIKN